MPLVTVAIGIISHTMDGDDDQSHEESDGGSASDG